MGQRAAFQRCAREARQTVSDSVLLTAQQQAWVSILRGDRIHSSEVSPDDASLLRASSSFVTARRKRAPVISGGNCGKRHADASSQVYAYDGDLSGEGDPRCFSKIKRRRPEGKSIFSSRDASEGSSFRRTHTRTPWCALPLLRRLMLLQTTRAYCSYCRGAHAVNAASGCKSIPAEPVSRRI